MRIRTRKKKRRREKKNWGKTGPVMGGIREKAMRDGTEILYLRNGQRYRVGEIAASCTILSWLIKLPLKLSKEFPLFRRGKNCGRR